MQIKSEKDFWSGVLFILFGLGFAAGALNYSFGSSARPGPAYFPFGLGLLTALLGLIVLVTSLTAKIEGGDKIGAWPFKPALLITVSVLLFGLALPRLGMALSLPLLIIVASLAGDEFHLGEVAVTCLVLTVGSWLVFIKGLGLIIPLWPIYFA